MVEKLELMMSWLMSLHLWSLEATRLWRCVEDTKEPITESGYAGLKAQEEAKLIPLMEAAEMALEMRWEGVEEGEDEDAAWDREAMSWAGRIEGAVQKRDVEGVPGPDGLQVRQGSLYGWLRESLPLFPEVGPGYDVHPDSEAKQVELKRKLRSAAFDAFKNSPSLEWTFDYTSEYGPELRDKSLDSIEKGNRMVRDLIEGISGKLLSHWAEIRAVEIVLEEAAAEFNGEDPARPQLREEINSLRETLCRIREEAAGYFGGVDLEEPTEENLELIRKFMLGDRSLGRG